MKEILHDIHDSTFNAAKQKRDNCLKIVNAWKESVVALSEKKLILATWCDEEVYFKKYLNPDMFLLHPNHGIKSIDMLVIRCIN